MAHRARRETSYHECGHAVADALWKKRTLSGEEVTEIIERTEDRIRSYPPSVWEVLKDLRSGNEERIR
jgi:ATP-dependent Zn protease